MKDFQEDQSWLGQDLPDSWDRCQFAQATCMAQLGEMDMGTSSKCPTKTIGLTFVLSQKKKKKLETRSRGRRLKASRTRESRFRKTNLFRRLHQWHVVDHSRANADQCGQQYVAALGDAFQPLGVLGQDLAGERARYQSWPMNASAWLGTPKAIRVSQCFPFSCQPPKRVPSKINLQRKEGQSPINPKQNWWFEPWISNSGSGSPRKKPKRPCQD